jgi:acetoin utilization deacetylase AcuC-like enzyme
MKIEDEIKNLKPNFVMYNAGTDCLVGDPLGDLSITEEGIV